MHMHSCFAFLRARIPLCIFHAVLDNPGVALDLVKGYPLLWVKNQ